MMTFIYNADIYCQDCGESIRARRLGVGVVDNGDSDTFPQGPYGPEEADRPQYCGSCGTFLQNSLTSDGLAYIQENPNSEWDAFYSVDRESLAEVSQ